MADFNDDRIIWGDRDPLVRNPTPGAVWRYKWPTARYDSSIIRPSRGPTFQNDVRIPPHYLAGGGTSYFTFLAFYTAAVDAHFSGVPTRTDGSDISLSTNALDDLVFVLRAPDGDIRHFAIDGAADTDAGAGRYRWAASFANAFLVSLRPVGGAVYLIDRSSPNVDLNNNAFLDLRGGLAGRVGNERFLRGVVEGENYLSLHTDTPPTAANQVVGGGYSTPSISTPNEWQFILDGVAQNFVRKSFGQATNAWTRATTVALWTGPSATGSLLWYDSILPFLARTGQDPAAAAGGVSLRTQNLSQ